MLSALIASAIASFIAFVLGMRFQRWRNIDYRQRWREALATIERIDRATIERIDTGDVREPWTDAARQRQEQLQSMASWDRAELEIRRAHAGLPPADDLRGMASWDVAEVLSVRDKLGRWGRA